MDAVAKPICHIVAGGPCVGLVIELAPGDLLIAADSGYAACCEAGLVPDLLIGDFDSLGVDAAVDSGIERIELPCAKDDTDTLAALREGLRRGFTRFEVHAALGGDVGHELANMQALLFLAEHGAHGVLHGGGQDLFLVTPQDGEIRVDVHEGMRVSVFAFAGTARGVYEKGLRWELEDATLEPSFPVGVSNCATGEQAFFSVRGGVLAVVMR